MRSPLTDEQAVIKNILILRSNYGDKTSVLSPVAFSPSWHGGSFVDNVPGKQHELRGGTFLSQSPLFHSLTSVL